MSLFAAVACASPSKRAEPPSNTPPEPAPVAAACPASGPELFAAHTTPTGRGVDLGESSVVLYQTGAWVTVRNGTTRTGCLSAADVAHIDRVLTGLPLQRAPIGARDVRCKAIDSSTTAIHVRGAFVYTRAMCSGDRIDRDTRAAVDAVIKLLYDRTGIA